MQVLVRNISCQSANVNTDLLCGQRGAGHAEADLHSLTE
jgi:hypothetical protein